MANQAHLTDEVGGRDELGRRAERYLRELATSK